MEEQNTIIELIDESGNTVKFDLVMTFDYEGKRYAALLPVDEVENVGDDEVVLLEVVKDKNGDNFVSIENPILLDEVFNEFIELFDEMADGEDEEPGATTLHDEYDHQAQQAQQEQAIDHDRPQLVAWELVQPAAHRGEDEHGGHGCDQAEHCHA